MTLTHHCGYFSTFSHALNVLFCHLYWIQHFIWLLEIYGSTIRLTSLQPLINDELPARVLSGWIELKADIQQILPTGVHFVDDTTLEDLDVIIMGTGDHTWQNRINNLIIVYSCILCIQWFLWSTSGIWSDLFYCNSWCCGDYCSNDFICCFDYRLYPFLDED